MLYSDIEEISTGLIPCLIKVLYKHTHTHTQVQTHTYSKIVPVFSPPVHEQAFNLSQLGQKHADLFTCQ